MKKEIKIFDIVKLKKITAKSKLNHGIIVKPVGIKSGSFRIDFPRGRSYGSYYNGYLPKNSEDLELVVTGRMEKILGLADGIEAYRLVPYGKYIEDFNTNIYGSTSILAPREIIIPTKKRIIDLREIKYHGEYTANEIINTKYEYIERRTRDENIRDPKSIENVRKYRPIFFQTDKMSFKQYMEATLKLMGNNPFGYFCPFCGISMFSEDVATRRYVRKDGAMTIKCPTCKKAAFIKIVCVPPRSSPASRTVEDHFYVALTKNNED